MTGRSACIFSRRAFARTLAGAALLPVCGRAEPEPFDWEQPAAPRLSLERRYRADAQVLLLGLPLLHRQNVGGGSVVWREFQADAPARLLEFRGFSAPERAAGLNRMGFIREMARFQNNRAECEYFGLMTSSPEESADEARKALHSHAKEQAFTAIDGHIGGGEIETTVAHFAVPASLSGEQSAELIEHARRALASVAKTSVPQPANETFQPFLQTMAEMLQSNGEEGRYLYMGRSYRIRLARSLDPKAATNFRERGLIRGASQVTRISGHVRRDTGGKESEFRLWVADGMERPLPLRIEYQPKSYLRLVFEAVG
jgi:hypothetical protein